MATAKKKPAPAPENENLVVIENELIPDLAIDVEQAFNENGTQVILDDIEKMVKASTVDVNNEESRAAAKALSRKISSLKTRVEEPGRNHLRSLKQKIKPIEGELKRFTDKMDLWRDQVKQPVTDWENTEQARLDVLNARILQMDNLKMLMPGMTSEQIDQRMRELLALYQFNWQEFQELADTTKDTAQTILKAALQHAKDFEAQAAENLRLKNAEEKRQSEERTANVAKQAKADAEKETERLRVKGHQDRINQMNSLTDGIGTIASTVIMDRVDRVHEMMKGYNWEEFKDRAEQTLTSVMDSLEDALPKAKDREQKAAEAETTRVSEAAAQKVRDDQKKKDDEAAEAARALAEDDKHKAHRKKINNAAIDAMLAHEKVAETVNIMGLEAKDAREFAIAILTAIVQKKVPNVTISY